MKNIVNFFKKNYRVLIPVIVVIVLLVTIFFFYHEYKYDNTRNKKEYDVFQYFSGVRVDYTAVVTYNLKEYIVDLGAKDKFIERNSFPIYYDDLSNVIFPSEMTIAFPLRNGSQFKLYKYATYYNKDGVHFINNNDNEVSTYNNFFLYDGKGVFFFPDKTTLKLNGKDYIELGEMSYVALIGGYTLTYFDTATEKAEAIELNGRIATVTGENLTVNISERFFKSFSSEVLLHTPNNLNPVFKTIDK